MYQFLDLDYDADGFKVSASDTGMHCLAACWVLSRCCAPLPLSIQNAGSALRVKRCSMRPQCCSPSTQARFVNATNLNWIAAWAACIVWQLAFVQQTPGGMWLALAAIVTAFLAMGRALVQLYRWRVVCEGQCGCRCGCKPPGLGSAVGV